MDAQLSTQTLVQEPQNCEVFRSAREMLRAGLLDWMSKRGEVGSPAGFGASGAAEVAIASALQRDAGPPRICARLRRGVGAEGVRQAFDRCLAQSDVVPGEGISLVVEEGPVRLLLADVYCSIETNDPAEHEFELMEALRAAEDLEQRRFEVLSQLVEETIALYPQASDELEELLCQTM